MLQSMGSQRVGHDIVSKQQQQYIYFLSWLFCQEKVPDLWSKALPARESCLWGLFSRPSSLLQGPRLTMVGRLLFSWCSPGSSKNRPLLCFWSLEKQTSAIPFAQLLSFSLIFQFIFLVTFSALWSLFSFVSMGYLEPFCLIVRR